jgi:hypothetical protein
LAESDWLLTGIVIGVLIGIPIGCILVQLFKPKEQASVIFDRDTEGKISGIHYVPVGGQS